MSTGLVEFTDANFEDEVLYSDKPVLVDFWAQWCEPCRSVGRLLYQIAEQFSGAIKVGKLNVDHDREVTCKYEIMAIPTLLLFKNGEAVHKFVGMPQHGKLEEAIDGLLDKLGQETTEARPA